jgi:hypothetical protein
MSLDSSSWKLSQFLSQLHSDFESGSLRFVRVAMQFSDEDEPVIVIDPAAKRRYRMLAHLPCDGGVPMGNRAIQL